MDYRMILFDFFNTLVLSDSSRIPTVEMGGKTVPSTAPLLRNRLATEYGEFEVAEVHRALRAASRHAVEKRGADLREPPALERFQNVLRELGLDGADGEAAQELLACHMEAVSGSFTFPEAHRGLLERLAKKRRLGIFSNFDHAPTLWALLRRNGIDGLFEPVVISETIGFRKPGRTAFQKALAMAAEAPERILFVGDSLEDDVAGALGAGLDVAWINPGGHEAPPDSRPTYTLGSLAELEPLLEKLTSTG